MFFFSSTAPFRNRFKNPTNIFDQTNSRGNLNFVRAAAFRLYHCGLGASSYCQLAVGHEGTRVWQFISKPLVYFRHHLANKMHAKY